MVARPATDKGGRYRRYGITGTARTARREAAIMKRIWQIRRPGTPRQPEPQDLRTPSGRPLPY